jgi:hypothetical protein
MKEIHLFEFDDNICKKIDESGCLDEKELRIVELALKIFTAHDIALNQCLGLEDGSKDAKFDFGFKYSIAAQHEKYVKDKQEG